MASLLIHNVSVYNIGLGLIGLGYRTRYTFELNLNASGVMMLHPRIMKATHFHGQLRSWDITSNCPTVYCLYNSLHLSLGQPRGCLTDGLLYFLVIMNQAANLAPNNMSLDWIVPGQPFYNVAYWIAFDKELSQLASARGWGIFLSDFRQVGHSIIIPRMEI